MDSFCLKSMRVRARLLVVSSVYGRKVSKCIKRLDMRRVEIHLLIEFHPRATRTNTSHTRPLLISERASQILVQPKRQVADPDPNSSNPSSFKTQTQIQLISFRHQKLYVTYRGEQKIS
jgi:hypothetical protein